MTTQHKTYLGDAVYADFDGFSIILTTEDGTSTHDTIVLEPDVLLALYRFVKDVHEKVQ